MSELRHPAPRWARWIAGGFGSGHLRPAPGTWGSLAAVAAWLLLRRPLAHLPGPGWAWGFLTCLALTGLGIHAATTVVRATGEKDPDWIVVDEWAGQWIALLPLWSASPAGGTPPLWDARVLLPLALFRLFDIWKPGFVHRLQALPEGWGVVMDDVLAGVYAALATALWLAVRS